MEIKKHYLVIAHCKDGDIAIKPKGKDYCETFEEAEEIKKDHIELGCPIEIMECGFPEE